MRAAKLSPVEKSRRVLSRKRQQFAPPGGVVDDDDGILAARP